MNIPKPFKKKMFSTTDINIDIISKIEMFIKRETGYKLWPAVPKKTILWGLITTDSGMEMGWAKNPSTRYNRLELDYFNCKSYIVDNDKVYYAPRVTVTYGYKNDITRYFKNNEDAIAWVNELKVKSRGNFETITHE